MAETSSAVTLPKIPKNRSYEDYLSARLNAGGYYLERGVQMNEGGDILELDIVINEFQKDTEVKKSIVEVKSGRHWGFPEIFKIKGWMSFLGYSKAAFIVQVIENKKMELYRRISDELNIHLILTPISGDTLDDTELKTYYSITPSKHYNCAVKCLQYTYALEHKLTDDIVNTCKSNEGITGYLDLRNYLEIINDSSFFESKPQSRLICIFDAYRKYRNITARIDQEKGGRPYISLTNDEQIRNETYRSLFYYCKDTDILQASLYVELQEKLYILKTCVEDLLRPAGQKSLFDDLGDELLPLTMKEGMSQLKGKPYFHLYPYFWQIFIFLFGGFIINDKQKKEEEYNLLSSITGIPVENIDSALEVFDLLFPLPNGGSWLYDIPKSTVTMLMFMPVPFCGIGVNFRRFVYTDDQELASLKKVLRGEKTFNDFIKWNNLAAAYLYKSKDVDKLKQE